MPTIKERIAGYEESLRDARLPRTKVLRLSNRTSATTALSALFASQNRPDALFTANNAATIWAIETLRERHIEVGKEVALIGFDDVDFFTLITPPITAIRQPAAELGRVATQQLLQKIKGNLSSSTVRTVLPVSLILRRSCGCKGRK